MSKPRRSINEWLLAWWNGREGDLNFGGPSKPDMRVLDAALSHPLESLGGKSLIAELAARGYDTTTLRFEIRRKPPDPE